LPDNNSKADIGKIMAEILGRRRSSCEKNSEIPAVLSLFLRKTATARTVRRSKRGSALTITALN